MYKPKNQYFSIIAEVAYYYVLHLILKILFEYKQKNLKKLLAIMEYWNNSI